MLRYCGCGFACVGPPPLTHSDRATLISFDHLVSAKQRLESLKPACRKYDRLEGHPTRICAELFAQCPHQGIDDSIRIDATTCFDLIDQRIAEDQPSREARESEISFSSLTTATLMSANPAPIRDSLIGSIW